MRLDVPARMTTHPYALGSLQPPGIRPTVTHSSSADDYRSVIDDLTIENKRLREELKRFKQFGPDLLRKEKLFELKVHGLPARKKRELEATLRDFAASLEGSSEAPSHRKKSKHASRSHGGSNSKHPSSSSSQSRPVDSAYASMSTGPNSSGTSLGRPSLSSRARSSEQKVEHYLQEIPEGLYPGFGTPDLPDGEKRKLVVKKLEQLFTGKISSRALARNQPSAPVESQAGPSGPSPSIAIPPSLAEPSREAQIQQDSHKKNRSRDNVSTSNSHSHSNGDQTESGGNGNGSGSGGGGGRGGGSNNTNTSPPTAQPPEQRPTRPRDLDPDRVQVPSENMEYIRHLGLVPPELLPQGEKTKLRGGKDVSADAEGWVYLNLLSNLAQLHMLNVSPDFIRKAVSGKSMKFQLSADGRKIRWRGGTEGTKFSSDSSGDNSQRSPSTDEDDGSDKNGQRKRQKTGESGGAGAGGGGGGGGGDDYTSSGKKNHSKFGPQVSGTSGSFHYKPLFIHRDSSMETSVDGTGSQESDQVEDSNLDNSRWDFSGSGSSPRKKRRADGAIVFYSGAPFCTDLSRDLGGSSPTTYMTSTGQDQGGTTDAGGNVVIRRLQAYRTPSGSSIPYRPISDRPALLFTAEKMDLDGERPPELTADDTDDDEAMSDDLESEFPWCDDASTTYAQPLRVFLEPSGVGRVFPEDHFAVMVTTRRPCVAVEPSKPSRSGSGSVGSVGRLASHDTADSITGRLENMSTASPRPSGRAKSPAPPTIEIEYVSGRLRRFEPAPLPPPARFLPPFSSSSQSTDGLSSESDEDEPAEEDEELLASSAEEILSKRANPHHSDNTYPDGEDLTSADEEDELGDKESEASLGRRIMAPLRAKGGDAPPELFRPSRNISAVVETKSPDLLHSGSSVATAGGAESGYSSSIEDA